MPRGRAPLGDRSTNRPGDQQPAPNADIKQLLLRKLEEFLHEIDDEVKERCDKLKDLEEAAIQELRDKLSKIRMTLPNKVKSMSIVAFQKDNSDPAQPLRQAEAQAAAGVLAAATPRQSKGRQAGSHMAAAAETPTTNASTRKRAREAENLGAEQVGSETTRRSLRPRRSGCAMMSTPLGSTIRSNGDIVATPSTVRLPRPNELVFSQNLSPLGNIHDGIITPLSVRPGSFATPMLTGTSKPAGRVPSEEPGRGMALRIDLGDGRPLQITSVQDLDALDENTRVAIRSFATNLATFEAREACAGVGSAR